MQIRDNILKVTPDHENRVVWVGGKCIENPTFIKSLKDVIQVSGVRDIKGHTWTNNKTRKRNGNKEFNKDLSERLGLPWSQWKKVYNYHAYSVWVDPVKYHVDKFSYNPAGVIDHMVEKVWKNKEILDQLYEDGIYNVAPACLKLEKNPNEAKKELGRSLWKKVSNNSFSRNFLIFSKHSLARRNCSEVFPELFNIPTTALNYNYPPDALIWACENRDCYLKNKYRIFQLVNLFRDTKGMADRHGFTFNPEWGLRRMQEEHDRMSNEITRMKYGGDPFPIYNEIGDLVIESENYRATMLTNPAEVAEEGSQMRHCVASYNMDCNMGSYVVFSITDFEGNRISTLGVSVSKQREEVATNQHYGKMNSRITDQEVLNLDCDVVGKLGEKLFGDKNATQ